MSVCVRAHVYGFQVRVREREREQASARARVRVCVRIRACIFSMRIYCKYIPAGSSFLFTPPMMY